MKCGKYFSGYFQIQICNKAVNGVNARQTRKTVRGVLLQESNPYYNYKNYSHITVGLIRVF